MFGFFRSKDELNSTDISFSKSALVASIRAIGIAFSDEAELGTMSDGLERGERVIVENGMNYIILLSLLSLGILSAYSASNNKSRSHMEKHMADINTRICDVFGANAEQVWNLRARILGDNILAKTILDEAALVGFSLPGHARQKREFRKLLSWFIDSNFVADEVVHVWEGYENGRYKLTYTAQHTETSGHPVVIKHVLRSDDLESLKPTALVQSIGGGDAILVDTQSGIRISIMGE
jgi:hypothetical protein